MPVPPPVEAAVVFDEDPETGGGVRGRLLLGIEVDWVKSNGSLFLCCEFDGICWDALIGWPVKKFVFTGGVTFFGGFIGEVVGGGVGSWTFLDGYSLTTGLG